MDKDKAQLAKQMGDAAKSGDEKKLAELTDQLTKDSNGEYVI